MFVINTATNNPTTKLLKDKCSRYCHNVTCAHTNATYKKYAGNWFADTAKSLYTKNIVWLHNNPFVPPLPRKHVRATVTVAYASVCGLCPV